MTIRLRLVLASLLILLVPRLATHLIVYSHSRSAVTGEVLGHLEAVAAVQEHRVESMLAQDLERLALPRKVKRWTLTTLRDKLGKIGTKVVQHAGYVVFQMAEVAVPRELFARILEWTGRLRSESG